MKLPKLAILEKEMTRAEFLKNLGLGALLVAGGGTLAKLAMSAGAGSGQQANIVGNTSAHASSYGGSVYGG